jgi:hypothetical protein
VNSVLALLFAKERSVPVLYELRTYEVLPGRMPALLQRFENLTGRMFERHGIRAVGYWTDMVGRNDSLTYILAWENLTEREARWGAFQRDPEWIAGRAKSEESGPIVARVINTIMQPTTFSALQ